jgi:2'-5' RNA ligase
MSETVRAFFAVDLDDVAVAHLAAAGERLRAALPAGLRASFPPPENLHVTLRFLGPTRLDDAAVLEQAMSPLATGAAPTLRIARASAFGSPKRAHVVVLELHDAGGALARMSAQLSRCAEALGFPREERPYRPHVTLARLKETRDVRAWLAALGPLEETPLGARAITLYRSDASPRGSVYTPIARAFFSATPTA